MSMKALSWSCVVGLLSIFSVSGLESQERIQQTGKGESAAAAPSSRGYIGLLVAHEKLDGRGGIRVMGVTPEGPASIAGITIGDLIFKINGEVLDFANGLEMDQFLGQFKAGDGLRLEVLRDDSIRHLEMTCGEMPEDRARAHSEWLERAEDRVRRGVDIYSCEEGSLDVDNAVAEGDVSQQLWAQFIRGITGDTELVIARQESGEVGVTVGNENPSAAGLTIQSLPPDFQELAQALKPGDSMRLAISFDSFLRRWQIDLADYPGYLNEVVESLQDPNAGSSSR